MPVGMVLKSSMSANAHLFQAFGNRRNVSVINPYCFLMNYEGELSFDDFRERLDIQDVLIDAGYQFYRPDGLRYVHSLGQSGKENLW